MPKKGWSHEEHRAVAGPLDPSRGPAERGVPTDRGARDGGAHGEIPVVDKGRVASESSGSAYRDLHRAAADEKLDEPWFGRGHRLVQGLRPMGPGDLAAECHAASVVSGPRLDDQLLL